ncbi:Rare lipoprotein A (RlpA)-like double-psi beta-barrel [Castilleja foliolosa]|uniref:Rare lipoprotein A (RlpA)-like double-psi beta-barrel n=1 Tax=Castilleja foliolosa TaxID=1961234 RepID=A0ABD3CTW9_9LAMI
MYGSVTYLYSGFYWSARPPRQAEQKFIRARQLGIYEAAEGDGSEGGACGYKTMVHANGYKKRETEVSDVLFKNGLGCGTCYKVMCYGHPLCNKKPITVVAMDQSPGGSWPHFDLSGSAFSRMAIDNRFAAGLRNVGKLKVAWTR